MPTAVRSSRRARLLASLLVVGAVAAGCGSDDDGDDTRGDDTGGAETSTETGGETEGTPAPAGLPNPCELVPEEQLTTIVGSGVTVEGPFDDAGNEVTGPFPYGDGDELTCTWNQTASSGSISVAADDGFQDTCELGMGGQVEGDRCTLPDSSATSGSALLLVDGTIVTILASGTDVDPVVEALVEHLTT